MFLLYYLATLLLLYICGFILFVFKWTHIVTRGYCKKRIFFYYGKFDFLIFKITVFVWAERYFVKKTMYTRGLLKFLFFFHVSHEIKPSISYITLLMSRVRKIFILILILLQCCLRFGRIQYSSSYIFHKDSFA